MTFTALCCEHSGIYQLQKVRALRELMQPHLCPAMGPILVQPHITRPLPPVSSGLGVCPDQTPTLLSAQLTLLSTQLTLLLQPFSDPSSHSGSSSRSSDREQASSAPINTSSSSPYSLSIQLCWLCGVLSHPCLSVHTGPSVPEPGSSVPGHRRVEDGTCHSHLFRQGAPVPSVFPQPSVGALDHL